LGLSQPDPINQMRAISVITLRGFHTTSYQLNCPPGLPRTSVSGWFTAQLKR